MNIDDFKKRKKQMEEAILKVVVDEVGSFVKETGCCPNMVSVGMLDVTTFGDSGRKYLPVSVETQVEL